jgi:hypothetical protein
METAYAQTSSYEELQAAYIFNFAKYVMWPTPSSPFVIGVYGGPKNMEYLKKAFDSKKIGGRPAEVRVVEREADLLQCNIVYLPSSESRNIKALISMVGKFNILIVTEDDLIKRGAGISFIIDDGRLKFKLKQSALDQAGLTATRGLLNLAIIE